MGRKARNRAKHRQSGRTRSQAAEPTLRHKPFYRRGSVWAWAVSFALAGVGLVALYFVSLVPHFVVEISGASVSSPLPLTFLGSKTGLMDAYDVEYLCFVFKMHAASPHVTIDMQDGAVGPFKLATTIGDPGARDFFCFGVHGATSSDGGDVEPIIKFRHRMSVAPSYDCARFKSRGNSAGGMQWFHAEPLDCRRLYECVMEDFRRDDEWKVQDREFWKNGARGTAPQMPKPLDCAKEAAR